MTDLILLSPEYRSLNRSNIRFYPGLAESTMVTRVRVVEASTGDADVT